ncbi:beta/gamma crystallin-related protein [Caulobacter sp. 17J65-9]|uniref:beta/gamma crystallin-related protein n=1 Tax=Caulobacter sp. 17J65-9 TaxID=2709382 RepID=UPI0013CD0531|nr:beta/gamma crystallin-related protein [Caulobacter sp. 17J65-9]NEX93323.1 beta/gamma crystallin family protein [Caulobacter sp. 17J65-9]
MRRVRPIVLAFVAALSAAGGLAAQDNPQERMLRPPGGAQATIFRDRNFSGSAVTVTGPRPDLGLAWPVRSVRIDRGRWEFCSQTNYRGQCVTATQSSSNFGLLGLGVRVQSMRPVSGEGGGSGGGDPGPSLRGMASEFFRAPRENGQRVRACPGGAATAACARRTADAFCRNRGWTDAAWNQLETEGGVAFLADVLCKH